MFALPSVFCAISVDAQFLSYSSFTSHMGGDGRMHQEVHTVDHSLVQGIDGRLHERVHEMESDTSQSGPVVQREKSEIICIDGRCKERESTQIGAMPVPISKSMPKPREAGLGGFIMDMGEYAARSRPLVPQTHTTLQRPQDIRLARIKRQITAIGCTFIGTLVALIVLKVCLPSAARVLPAELKEPLSPEETAEVEAPVQGEELSAVPLTPLVDFLKMDDEQEVPFSGLGFKFKPSVGSWYCEKLPKKVQQRPFGVSSKLALW